MTASTSRVRSIDIVRGIVMVLMAIDHVRVYSGLPAGGPSPGIFFTRWITNFCAPAFVFLAGTGAFLYGDGLFSRRSGTGLPTSSRNRSAGVSRYLLVRGVLLVLLEPTLIRFTWTFNVDYSQFVLAGVIWMLGWCMVLMAALVWLPAKTVGFVGVAIMVLQPLFGAALTPLPPAAAERVGAVWEYIYPAGFQNVPPVVNILYTIVPWIGVMAAGYGFGAIVVLPPDRRRRLCLRIGVGATLLFVAGALATLSPGDVSEETPSALFRLLNQQKYPASQLFLLMTLGPTIALLPAAERWRGWLASAMATFGRVPMFYYLLHIPLIHIAALAATYLREGMTHPEWYATAPYTNVPSEHQWPLGLLYVVFAIVVALLYLPCRWFARLKSEGRAGWLRYI